MIKNIKKILCFSFQLVLFSTLFMLGVTLVLKNSFKYDNIEKVVNKIDFIKDSTQLFGLEDRFIEKKINSIEIFGLSYQTKKEIIYDSKMYEKIKKHFIDLTYNAIKYNKKVSFLENDKEIIKNDLIEEIEKNNVKLDEISSQKIEDIVDDVYDYINKISIYDDFIDSNSGQITSFIFNNNSIVLLIAISLFSLLILYFTHKKRISIFIDLVFSSSLIFVLFNFISSLFIKMDLDFKYKIILNLSKDLMMKSFKNYSIIFLIISIVSILLFIIAKLFIRNNTKDDLGKTMIDINKIDINNTKI